MLKTFSSFISILLVVWNIISALAGLGLISAALFLFYGDNPGTVYYVIVGIREVLFDVRLVLISVGSVIVLVAVVYIVGIATRRKLLLQVYCYITILIMLSQLGFCTFIYINKDNLVQIVEMECQGKVAGYGETPTVLVDTIQEKLRCCGCLGPQDYINTFNTIPSTCYNADMPFSLGCLNVIFELVNANSTWIIVTGITISLLQLIMVVAVNWQIIKQYSSRSTARISPSPSSRSILTNNWVDVERHPRISKISKKSTTRPVLLQRESSF